MVTTFELDLYFVVKSILYRFHSIWFGQTKVRGRKLTLGCMYRYTKKLNIPCNSEGIKKSVFIVLIKIHILNSGTENVYTANHHVFICIFCSATISINMCKELWIYLNLKPCILCTVSDVTSRRKVYTSTNTTTMYCSNHWFWTLKYIMIFISAFLL